MEDYLAKYRPETALFAQPQFTIDAELPPKEKAFATWRALLIAKRNHEGLFLIIGKLLKDVRDDKLYLDMDYENFSEFLESEELDFSREKAYMCIKTYEYYIDYLQMDPDHIGKMNISKLSMMVPMLKQIEDKTEVVKEIERLSGMRHGDFVREVKTQTNLDGKPSTYYSNEQGKWVVNYYKNTTFLQDIGDFNAPVKAIEG
jgi:hypothetical protein